jgi:hypothetical protein
MLCCLVLLQVRQLQPVLAGLSAQEAQLQDSLTKVEELQMVRPLL